MSPSSSASQRSASALASCLFALGFFALLAGCDEDVTVLDGGEDGGGADAGPASALADYAAPELYAAPWPDERLRRADGTVDISAFPNPRGVPIVDQLTDILRGADGFAISSTIYFPLSGPIDETSLPADPHASLIPNSSVFLVDVDPSSPDLGRRTPVDVSFAIDPGPFGVPNLLAVLPLQGRPLHPGRLYAAVVRTRVRQLDGTSVGVAPATAALLRAERPEGMSDGAFAAHQTAIDALHTHGIDDESVVAMAVFRTWDPTRELSEARAQVLAAPLPTPSAFEPREVFDDYCVFHATVPMPDFQAGDPPYESTGGAWARGADGTLVTQRDATSTIWVTVPRRAMPDGGFPTAVFVRTGGGGDRPMVDRGPHAEPHGEAIAPGTGPALQFARAGFAGVSVDGPLGGLRNSGGWDEQFAIFNINNPAGLRDNIRQSALELMLLAQLLPTLSIDASSCAGFDTTAGDGIAHLDSAALTLMGHSMGATIAPLAVALEPAYRALILSGAGGSWIENVIFKESPIHVRPAAESLLRYSAQGRAVTEHDPALALLQWAGEPADPQVYARAIIDAPIVGAPRSVLMFQGILDTYIPPPVANALSLAMGLDLAGGALDARLSDRFVSLAGLLDLAGSAMIDLPAGANRGSGAITGVVVQHEEDGIEDGHEVAFQTADAPHQYRCFLESLAAGAPRVPSRDGATCD